MAAHKTLLFDFDGTLIDSSASILASFALALERLGLQPVVPLEKSLIGPPLRDTLRKITGIDDAGEIERLVEAFKAEYDNGGYRQTEVYPGIDAALRSLHAAGIAMYIVTNKRILPTTRILAHLGWDRLFAGVHALDSTQPPAANKTALVGQVLAQHGIDAACAMMVGDTPEDGHAASGNGVAFAAATWGYGHFVPDILPGKNMLASPEEIGRLA